MSLEGSAKFLFEGGIDETEQPKQKEYFPAFGPTPHHELGLFSKMLRIFTPFFIMRRLKHNPDGFTFPQAFITGTVIAIISVGYMTI